MNLPSQRPSSKRAPQKADQPAKQLASVESGPRISVRPAGAPDPTRALIQPLADVITPLGPACFRLDPIWVVPSRWPNRIQEAYRDQAFIALCADIQESGGNAVAIKVRPISVGASNNPAGGSAHYEIVYGHRRHRACLQMGLPVKAIVEPVDDKQLLEEMLAENSKHSDVSAFESGLLYRQLLDDGAYPSMRRLATAIRRDVADVSRAMALAALPTALIDALTSPRELALHDAGKFTAAIARDPNRATEIATQLAAIDGPVRPKELLRAINEGQALAAAARPDHDVTPLIANGKKVGEFGIAPDGKVEMTIRPGLPRTQLEALRNQVRAFIESTAR